MPSRSQADDSKARWTGNKSMPAWKSIELRMFKLIFERKESGGGLNQKQCWIFSKRRFIILYKDFLKQQWEKRDWKVYQASDWYVLQNKLKALLATCSMDVVAPVVRNIVVVDIAVMSVRWRIYSKLQEGIYRSVPRLSTNPVGVV